MLAKMHQVTLQLRNNQSYQQKLYTTSPQVAAQQLGTRDTFKIMNVFKFGFVS
jgi:hypothetical protein